MAHFKWGGTFSALDSATRQPVTGTIGGEFTGEYPADQEPMVKSLILATVNDVLGSGGSIEDAVDDFPALGRRLSAALEGPLAKVGGRGNTTVVFAKRR
ncbi:MAG TPA: hypothetical protein VGK67_08500 [Myxococcales bacterium]|jgi:hypothetical protein